MKYLDIKKSKKNSENSAPGINLKIGVIVLFFFLIIGGIVGLLVKFKVKPIQVIANATIINLKETDGRTNILILGSDKRSFDFVSFIV